MILRAPTGVTTLSRIGAVRCTVRMTRDDEHDDTRRDEPQADPQPASEALPDGQFQDQEMPTTDGEPADPDPHPGTAGEHADDDDPLPKTTDDQGRPLENPSGG